MVFVRRGFFVFARGPRSNVFTMPQYDSRGQRLRIGDRVTLEAIVTEVLDTAQPDTCCVEFQLQGSATNLPTVLCSGLLCTREEVQ